MANKKIIDGEKSTAKSQNQNGVKKTPIIVSVSIDDIMAIEKQICKKHNEAVVTSKRPKYVGKVTPIRDTTYFTEWHTCKINRTHVYFLYLPKELANRHIEYHFRKERTRQIGDKLLVGVGDVIGTAMVREDGSVYLGGLHDVDIVTDADNMITVDWRLMWLPDGKMYNSNYVVDKL